MKAKLIVKNFGPIVDATLDIRNVNVLIGPQASGKSTLAKLYTICKSPALFLPINRGDRNDMIFSGSWDLSGIIRSFSNVKLSIEKFKESLDHFGLSSYLASNSEILFESDSHKVIIRGKTILFEDELHIHSLMEAYEANDLKTVYLELDRLKKKSDDFLFELAICRLKEDDIDQFLKLYDTVRRNTSESLGLTKKNVSELIAFAKELQYKTLTNNAIYIPAERTIVNLLKQAALNFRKINVPIPGHLLDYAAQYESATYEFKELDLGFIQKGVKYRNIDGQDKIYFSPRKSVSLTDSASGFQSIVPMLLPIKSFVKNDIFSHYSFVIEEPETNLFPSAQYEVIKYLEGSRHNEDQEVVDRGMVHFYTTHSPFILTALNNLLYAYKKGEENAGINRDKIKKIINQDSWINPDNFSAYEIKNGLAKTIFNRRSGLIKENAIDKVSNSIIDDFRKIALASV